MFIKALHRTLGEVTITDECQSRQDLNPDYERTVFVEHEGKIKEVTRMALRLQIECQFCKHTWYEGDDPRHNCL